MLGQRELARFLLALAALTSQAVRYFRGKYYLQSKGLAGCANWASTYKGRKTKAVDFLARRNKKDTTSCIRIEFGSLWPTSKIIPSVSYIILPGG